MKTKELINLFIGSRRLLFFLALLSWITSCVPNAKLTYLQYEDDIKTKNPADSIMRVYKLKTDEYHLAPGDIISVRVASVTSSEYDFITKYQTDLGIIRKLSQYQQSLEGGDGNNNNMNRFGGGGNQQALTGLLISGQNTGFTLDNAGQLELPEIGSVTLAGLTISEAEMKIKELLEGYYEIPMVRVQLLNYHFTVLGEVSSEGRYTSFDPKLTIFDAISLAGNIGEFADRSNIKIVRQEQGQAKVLYLDMLDETTLNADNFYIQRDDIIVVPALKARTTSKYTLKNVSIFLGIATAVLSITALTISLSNR